MKRPDITPAQIVAIVAATLGVLAAAGLPISHDLQDHILNLVTVLAPVLVGADAAIRVGRNLGERRKHDH